MLSATRKSRCCALSRLEDSIRAVPPLSSWGASSPWHPLVYGHTTQPWHLLSHGVLWCCFCASPLFHKVTRHTGWAHPNDFIFSWSYVQKPCFQAGSQSQGLGWGFSTFLEDTIQPKQRDRWADRSWPLDWAFSFESGPSHVSPEPQLPSFFASPLWFGDLLHRSTLGLLPPGTPGSCDRSPCWQALSLHQTLDAEPALGPRPPFPRIPRYTALASGSFLRA